MTKKKVLYIDFDGTITSDRYWRSLSDEHHHRIQTLLFSENRQMVGDWMRGKYSAEEVNEYAAETLNIPYDYLWDLFVSDCETILVDVRLLGLIAELKQEYIVVLITGNMDSFSRFTVPALKLDSYFDYISNSFYEGKQKTDNEGELFGDWSKKLNISLGESILIDDQKKCCEIFSRLGGIAYKTKSEKETEEIILQLLQKTL